MRLICLALLFTACQQSPKQVAPPAAPVSASQPAAESAIDPGKLRSFARLPAFMDSAQNPTSESKALLGKTLFFDGRLSQAGDVSCNSCHVLENWGVDARALAPKQKRNTPTVFNAAGHVAQFADGRSPDLETAIKEHLLDPSVMGNANGAAIASRLSAVKGYAPLFTSAFPKAAPSFDSVVRALAVFVRTLVVPARWDIYIAGDDGVLSNVEKQGFNLFVDTGCIACHSGAFVGGHLMQKLGATKPWPSMTDQGRYDVSKAEADKMIFKVSSLRNVDKTAPYFHDGSVATLNEAIFLMGEYQLGKKLALADVQRIAAWMRTLTSEVPARLLEPPTLP